MLEPDRVQESRGDGEEVERAKYQSEQCWDERRSQSLEYDESGSIKAQVVGTAISGRGDWERKPLSLSQCPNSQKG